MSDEDEDRAGELLFSGNANWSLIGRSEATSKFDGITECQLPNFHRMKSLMGIKIKTCFSGTTAAHCFAVSEDGTLFSWGRNEYGELGHGHVTNVYLPTKVQKFVEEDIKMLSGSAGGHHSIVYSEDGRCYAAGQGSSGQLGIGKTPETLKNFTQLSSVTEKVINSSCGREFSMIVTADGKLRSFGHPMYGQLGNGGEFKSLERANKMSYKFTTIPTAIEFADNPLDPENSPEMFQVECGANHTVARDKEGRIWTWGFGGYGRLGHRDNKNQFLPKALVTFHDEEQKADLSKPKFMQRTVPATRATQISCGASASYAVVGAPYFSLYMWGITKKSGEAVMYPKICDEVSGWRVRSVSCGNTSTIVASGRTTITWGPSPTYGELGYGVDGPKSSTKSRKVDDLDHCKVLKVAMGFSHSLIIVDTGAGEKKAEKIVDALPVFDPQVEPKEGVEELGKKRKKGPARKNTKKKKLSDDEGPSTTEATSPVAETQVTNDDPEKKTAEDTPAA